MALSIFLFIFTYSLFIACITLLVLAYDFSKKKETYFREIKEFYASETDKEIENLIDDRLSDIVTSFKQKIPMIGMFLPEVKERELKESAKTKLMQMIPDIKQRFSGSDFFSQFAESLWRQMRNRFVLVAICTGALLGLLEVGLMLIFFK
jgi:Flp pilus assembly protein TadB